MTTDDDFSAATCSKKLRAYIDDGELKRDIMAQQTPLYEHISFVAWNHDDRICDILLAGTDPNGYTNIQRNVLTMDYNYGVTQELIRKKFDFVDMVSTVLSNDDEFDAITVRKYDEK